MYSTVFLSENLETGGEDQTLSLQRGNMTHAGDVEASAGGRTRHGPGHRCRVPPGHPLATSCSGLYLEFWVPCILIWGSAGLNWSWAWGGFTDSEIFS